MIILGIDPGFRNTGYAVVEVSGGKIIPKKLGVIRTKEDKTLSLMKSEHNMLRAQTVFDNLINQIREFRVKVLCVESMSFPRNAAAAAKMAMCWGVIASIGSLRNMPVHQASPIRIKRYVTGLKKSSKEEVQYALNHKFKGLENYAKNIPKTLIEHPYDALAVAVTIIEQTESVEDLIL